MSKPGVMASETTATLDRRRIHAGWRPELDILLGATSAFVDSSAQERIRQLLDGSIDWDSLLESAQRHRIVPLLNRALRAAGENRIPAAVQTKLHAASFENVWRSLLLIGETAEVLEMFKANGIQGLPYKGPALSILLYGDTALRQCGDLDILVPEKDVPKAMELLATRNYVCVTTHATADKDRRFVRNDGRVVVELHWAVTSQNFACRFDVERLWHDLSHVKLAGRSIAHVSPENLLLILTVHGTKHHWERLLWILDIAQFVRVYPNFDWVRTFEVATKYGIARMLRLALTLARDLGGAALPPTASRLVAADPEVQRLANQIIHSVIDGTHQNWTRADKSSFFMAVRERRVDKLRFAARMIVHAVSTRVRSAKGKTE